MSAIPFDRQSLDSDQQRAWRLLLTVNSQLFSALNRQLQSDSGLSFQDFDVLVHLRESPEHRLRMGALSRALGWERSRTSHHVVRMERRGLVHRQRVPGDGRGALVVATAEGMRQLDQAAPRHLDLVKELLFGGMDPATAVHLADALSVVARNLGYVPGPTWYHDEPDDAGPDGSSMEESSSVED